MADAKHTPGSWDWEYDPDTGRRIALAGKDTDVLLATGISGKAWVEVSDADADLIAAAPGLLAACRRAAMRLSGDLGNYGSTEYRATVTDRERLERLVADLRTAVAKATGEG